MPTKTKNHSDMRLDLFGDKEFVEALKTLKESVRNRIIAAGVRGASSEMSRRMKSVISGHNFTDSTGILRKSIGIKPPKKRKWGVYAVAGPRRGMSVPSPRNRKAKGGGPLMRTPTKYFHILERGARPHSIVRGQSFRNDNVSLINHPGSRAFPTVSTVMKSSGDGIRQRAEQTMIKQIATEARRLARKSEKYNVKL